MAQRQLRLLCLDGGGVRGLASLLLLKKLLSFVGNPKPCEWFDMIGGTSTGGLIAIMLGRLELDIETCIEEFTNIMGPIFKKKHHTPVSPFTGKVQPRFDTSTLEKSIKQLIERRGLPQDTLMRGQKASACKTFVVALTDEGTTLVQFTDYERVGEMSNTFKLAKIWEAARATSAATSFFAPIEISSGGSRRKFLDGALGANNPVYRMWIEAQQQFGSPLEPQIRILLSLGTGRPPLTAFGESVKEVGKSIIEISKGTENTAREFHGTHTELADRHAYFRFNPPDISEVGLEEAQKRNIIEERTEAYGEDPFIEQHIRRFQQSAGEEQSVSTQAFLEMMQFA